MGEGACEQRERNEIIFAFRRLEPETMRHPNSRAELGDGVHRGGRGGDQCPGDARASGGGRGFNVRINK